MEEDQTEYVPEDEYPEKESAGEECECTCCGAACPGGIFLWKKPIVSASILVFGNLFFYLVGSCGYRYFTTLAILVCFAVIGVTVFSEVYFRMKKVRPFSYEERKYGVLKLDEEKIEEINEHIDKHINKIMRVVKVVDLKLNIKIALLAIWALFWGKMLSGTTLAMLAFNKMFLMPILYKKYKDRIDPLFEMGNSILNEKLDLVIAAVEKKVAPKDKKED